MKEKEYLAMNKNYPNYKSTKKDLSKLFTLIQKMGHFPTSNELSVAFDDWCLQYSIIYPSFY
jgi:hypothetical protein